MSDITDELRKFLVSLLRPIINEAIKENLTAQKEVNNENHTSSTFVFDMIPVKKIFKEKIMSKRTFYRRRKEKKIKLLKVGNLSFIKVSDFNMMFEEAYPTAIERLRKKVNE